MDALLIFAISYLAMAGARFPFIRMDRPAAALCGAVAMVVGGVISLDHALESIDLEVIVLLVGMMLVASYLRQANFFRYSAWFVVTKARSPQRLLWMLTFVAGALSALLLNDTICLMFTPLVVAVAAEAGLPAMPYLLALAAATNVGGVATFTGNPQNMIIGQAAAGSPSFLDYSMIGIPIAALSLTVIPIVIAWMFRTELVGIPLDVSESPRPYLDRRLAAKALVSLAGFVVAAATGASMAGSAVAAASALILMARTEPKEALSNIDWSLVLFFAGLFVLVEGLTNSLDLAVVSEALGRATVDPGVKSDAVLAASTIVGSNVVSNVPYVIVAVEWIPTLADPARDFTCLAIFSTLAGNLTPFGSAANIIVLETAGPRGNIRFLHFVRYGAVITFATSAVALGVIWLATRFGVYPLG